MSTRTNIARHITFAVLLAGLSGCSSSVPTAQGDAEADVTLADAQVDPQTGDVALPDTGAPSDCNTCRCDILPPGPNDTRPVCGPEATCCLAIGPLPPPDCAV